MNDDIISHYSRHQALADGVLIDATALAAECGIRYPVALTAAAWQKCVAVPPGVTGQDPTGRLWDVLTMFRHAARGASGAVLEFSVLVQNAEHTPPAEVRLQALCGPGDHFEPVITIGLPGED